MTSAAKSPADMLADIGRALYGERWRLPLAEAVGISEATLRGWMGVGAAADRRQRPLTPDHGVMDDALVLVRRRAGELQAAAETLEAWLAEARNAKAASELGG